MPYGHGLSMQRTPAQGSVNSIENEETDVNADTTSYIVPSQGNNALRSELKSVDYLYSGNDKK